MKAERVILSFIALLIGLGVAGGVFYLYQMTKNAPAKKSQALPTVTIPSPTPLASNHIFILDKPSSDEVVSANSTTISGKTEKGTIIVVRTETQEEVAESASDGAFTLKLPLAQGVNTLVVNALFPDGTQASETRNVTYSSESF